MLDPSEQSRIEALTSGRSPPGDGFEKHFLNVIAGVGRPLTPREREWLAYWQTHLQTRALPDAAASSVVAKRRSVTPVRPTKPPKVRRAATPEDKSRPCNESMVDLAVVAANMGNNIHSIPDASSDPLVARALEMTTNRPISELAADPDALQGAINAAKGKYFELLVEERLNAGEQVGDLVLADGHRAELAQSMSQPGWDMAILDSSSHVVDLVQIKATDSTAYIRETLERYPDIKILSTAEAARVEVGQGLVLDSGVSNADIERALGQVLDDQSDAFLQSFLESFNPVLPLVFIVATEGYKVVVGQRSVLLAAESAASRAQHGLTGAAVGAVFYAMGFGWLSLVPAVVSSKMGPQGIIDFVENWYRTQREESLRTRAEENAQAAQRYTRQLQKYGSTRELTPEQIDEMRVEPTGISAIDRVLSDFVRGWRLAGEPEVQEAIRRENEAEFERAKQRALDRLAKTLPQKPDGGNGV